MKLIDKCSNCKHLNTMETKHYGYAMCNKIKGIVSTDSQGWDKIITADTDYYELPNEIINNDYVGYPLFDELKKKWEFKEKWEDKDETN